MGKIVSIEGIDGSGKSFWAEKLEKLMGDKAIFLSKKMLNYSDEGYIRKINEQIGDILWKSKADTPIELLTDEGWLFLHLFWYTVFSENILRKYKDKFDYVIIDGWYYKILARFLAKEKYDSNFLMSLFKHLLKPDLIIYLDFDPNICYGRKSSFNKCELGTADGKKGDPKKCFVEYQLLVKEKYLDLLKKIKDEKKMVIYDEQIQEKEMRSIIMEKLDGYS